MKTNVEVKADVYQSCIRKGDVGYIDGYVRAADDRAYAVVVIPEKAMLDMVQPHNLKVIDGEKEIDLYRGSIK